MPTIIIQFTMGRRWNIGIELKPFTNRSGLVLQLLHHKSKWRGIHGFIACPDKSKLEPASVSDLDL